MENNDEEIDRPARWMMDWRVLAILFLSSVCLSVIATDPARTPTEPVHIGEIAQHTVKAPYRFTWQDKAAWEARRQEAAQHVSPVFVWNANLAVSAKERVTAAFRAGREALGGQPERAQERVRREAAIQRFLDAGAFSLQSRALRDLAEAGFPTEAEARLLARLSEVFDQRLIVASRDDLPASQSITVVPKTGGEAREVVELRRIMTPNEVQDALALTGLAARAAPWSEDVSMIARSLVRPNLAADPARTEDARAAALAAVTPQVVVVEKGETLFREGDKLTDRDVARYEALRHSHTQASALFERMATGAFLFAALIILTAASLTLGLGRGEENRLRAIGTSAATVIFIAALTRAVVAMSPGIVELIGHDAQPRFIWYLAPVAAGVMLTRLVMDTGRAAWVLVATLIVTALIVRMDTLVMVYFLLVGVIALSNTTRVRDRVDVLRTGLIVGVVGALVVVLGHFVELYSVNGEVSRAVAIRPLWSMLFALAGGLFSGVLVLGLMPILERVGFVTDHRLLELANLNHPLMKQLMIRAPGTYHHSVMVGTLAEAACESIGANGTLAKICAYFHDIGKTLAPQYFVENQKGGANRHTGLDPLTSAEHIIRHVTDGARMAREHNLPKPIIDNILMHHGTGILQYFYAKAQMAADDPASVDESKFRYPGPMPNTREAGVIMIADKIEAATRTIKQPNEDNIRAMTERIIDSILADNQFDACPLTLAEIRSVKETCIRVLVAIYHQRIEYPQTAALSSGIPTPQTSGLKGPGTITLELEAAQVAADQPIWRGDRDATDETTDYESVRNLPHGRP